MAKGKLDTEREEAKRELRKLLKPGQTVYCILRHRSASGMSRVIDLCIAQMEYREDYPLKPADQAAFEGEKDYSAKPKRTRIGCSIRGIGWLAAKAMGDEMDRERPGIRVSGCGMDMGFHLVYNLGRTLYPEGFAPSDSGIRPIDGKLVNVNIGRGRDAGSMTQAEMNSLAAKGWKFTGGRNGDQSGWDTDGGYALKSSWL